MIANKSFYGWKLLLVFWAVMILNFAFPTFGMSVVNTYMGKAMHFDREELGLAYSVFALMAGLPGPLVGLSINRFGIRLTMLAGTLLVAFGALLMAAAVHTAPQAILVLALVVGFGAALSGTIGPQVGMARWFRAKRGRAISLLLTASGIGGFAAVPLLNRLIAASGGNWRSAWWCMGAMSLCAAVLAGIFIRESPAQLGQEPDGGLAEIAAANAAGAKGPRGVFKTAEDWTLGEALRSSVLWMLTLTYVGFFMGFFIYVAHGIAHLEGLGHTPAAAARSIAIIMLSSLIGQFAVAALGDRIETRYLFAIAVALFGIGIALATHATGAVALYPYAICMGSGFGAAFTCLAMMLTNYFGPKIYPLVLGVVTPIGTILGAVGPVIAGWFYDRYGSYSQIFYLVAGICFASAILLPLAGPPVRRLARRKAPAAVRATP
jgi:MFS family permease